MSFLHSSETLFNGHVYQESGNLLRNLNIYLQNLTTFETFIDF